MAKNETPCHICKTPLAFAPYKIGEKWYCRYCYEKLCDEEYLNEMSKIWGIENDKKRNKTGN